MIQHEIIGCYLTDNWRAFRTWGVSAISPWEYQFFWTLRSGVDKSRKQLPVDWDKLQRPGFSADYLGEQMERMDLAYERSDWLPTADGQALLRNNMPLLAYIAGKPDAFTSKDHNFYPGETVGKQLVVINNSRETSPATASSMGVRTPEPVEHLFDDDSESVKAVVPPGSPASNRHDETTVHFSAIGGGSAFQSKVKTGGQAG